MALRSISTRISLYGLVGVAALAVHTGVLLALEVMMPEWLANRPVARAEQRSGLFAVEPPPGATAGSTFDAVTSDGMQLTLRVPDRWHAPPAARAAARRLSVS